MKKYWTTCLLCMMLLVLSGCQKEEKPIKVIEKEPVKIISLSITPMAEEEKQEEEELLHQSLLILNQHILKQYKYSS